MNMEISKRMSGRYPWGEGVEAFPNALAFVEKVKTLKNQGVPEEEVLKEINALLPEDRRMKLTGFRMAIRTAFHERKREQLAEIYHLRNEGCSWHDISCRMELSETTVKSMYANRKTSEERRSKQKKLMETLKAQTEKAGMVVIPDFQCNEYGVQQCWLNEVFYRLETEADFNRFGIKCRSENWTVLTQPGITREYVLAHRDEIQPFIWPEDLDRAAES